MKEFNYLKKQYKVVFQQENNNQPRPCITIFILKLEALNGAVVAGIYFTKYNSNTCFICTVLHNSLIKSLYSKLLRE